MKKLLHYVEKLLGIYRVHPKIALRYLPLVSEINKLSYPASILEVGSGGIGIAPYIKKSVVGVDLVFPKPVHEKLIPVSANALDLPFVANSFDVVLSTDMLEHIDPQNRSIAISEMLRVAKKLVLIGVPTGYLAHMQDEALKEIYVKKHGKGFNFLEEQTEYGLPTKEVMQTMIEDGAKALHKKISLRYYGNINLRLRFFLMQGWISKNLLINIFFRKLLLFFIPLMMRMNQEPTYRTIFTVKIY